MLCRARHGRRRPRQQRVGSVLGQTIKSIATVTPKIVRFSRNLYLETRLTLQLERGLTEQGVKTLLSRAVENGKVVEYLIPDNTYGNLFVKATNDEVLVGYAKTEQNTDILVILADKKGSNSLTGKLANATEEDIKKLADDAVGGSQTRKFTQKQIDDYLVFATKNPKARNVMLGKYLGGGEASYITRAGKDYTYFDMGVEKWEEAEVLVNENPAEMWRINKQFIDEQKSLGKDFYFSYEPWIVQSHEYLSKEAEYLIDLGAKDFLKINDNTWKVIW